MLFFSLWGKFNVAMHGALQFDYKDFLAGGGCITTMQFFFHLAAFFKTKSRRPFVDWSQMQLES